MDDDDESSNTPLIDHKTRIFYDDSEDGSNNMLLIDYDSVGDEPVTIHNTWFILLLKVNNFLYLQIVAGLRRQTLHITHLILLATTLAYLILSKYS